MPDMAIPVWYIPTTQLKYPIIVHKYLMAVKYFLLAILSWLVNSKQGGLSVSFGSVLSIEVTEYRFADNVWACAIMYHVCSSSNSVVRSRLWIWLGFECKSCRMQGVQHNKVFCNLVKSMSSHMVFSRLPQWSCLSKSYNFCILGVPLGSYTSGQNLWKHTIEVLVAKFFCHLLHVLVCWFALFEMQVVLIVRCEWESHMNVVLLGDKIFKFLKFASVYTEL